MQNSSARSRPRKTFARPTVVVFALFWLLFPQESQASSCVSAALTLSFRPKQIVRADGACRLLISLDSGRVVCISDRLWRDALKEGRLGRAGEAALFCGTWKASSPPQNEVGHLKRIRKTLRVTQMKLARSWRMVLFLERLREDGSRRIQARDRLGFFRRLFFDERGGDAERSLRLLGFVHHTTLAGIHVYALSNAFTRISGSVVYVRAAGIWVSTLLLWVLSGFRFALFRAVSLIGLRRLAAHAGFRWRWYSPLLVLLLTETGLEVVRTLAGGVVTVDERMGQWHYLLAVLGAVYGIESARGKSPWQRHVAMSLGSWAFLVPLQLIHGDLISVATPVISLITLPLLVDLIFPITLGFLWIAPESASEIVGLTTDGIEEMAMGVARVLPPILPSHVVFGFAAAGVLLLQVRTRPKLLVGFLLLALLRPIPHPIKIEQLDVGQGDSALVNYLQDGQSVFGLIDTGLTASLSQSAWIQLLGRRRVPKLRWILLTHWDLDHVGGLSTLLSVVEIECVVLPASNPETTAARDLLQALARLHIHTTQNAGECLPFPTTVVRSTDAKHRATGNIVMRAILIPSREGAFLSAGDSDSTQEAALLPWLHQQLGDAPLTLKLGHHGSRTSSDLRWLGSLPLKEVWVSAGLGNSYGHPSGDVLSRLEEFPHVRLRRTDRDGILATELEK